MSQMSHSNIRKCHTSKRRLLNFKINVSAFLGRRLQRWTGTMSAAVLKSLSNGTLVGGGARNFCVSGGDNWGNLCMFIFHQEAGSSWWLMSGPTRTDPILHLYSYHQLTCPELLCRNNSRDWILFGCSLLLTEVEDSSRSSSTISCC